MKVEALFISDVHLGSKGSCVAQLLEVLKDYEPKHLFIVGDFIDGWILKKRHYWCNDYNSVIRKIMQLSQRGTRVIYITGNHDDFLRGYSPMSLGDSIQIVDEYIWNGYYICHGDKFDGIVKLKWLGILGSVGYEIAISFDRLIKRLGYKFSLSAFLKKNVKNAIKFITNFETQLAYQAKHHGCHGVIAGHIHTPDNKMIDDIHYLNCGDWVENCSYIIYDKQEFTIKFYN